MGKLITITASLEMVNYDYSDREKAEYDYSRTLDSSYDYDYAIAQIFGVSAFTITKYDCSQTDSWPQETVRFSGVSRPMDCVVRLCDGASLGVYLRLIIYLSRANYIYRVHLTLTCMAWPPTILLYMYYIIYYGLPTCTYPCSLYYNQCLVTPFRWVFCNRIVTHWILDLRSHVLIIIIASSLLDHCMVCTYM